MMEKKDIQGLLLRGHGDLPAAVYLLLEIEKAEKARRWLKKVVGEITDGVCKPKDKRMQLAFGYSGLEKLGLGESKASGWSVEFVQGMATEYRARVLGDLGESAAEHWNWGGSGKKRIDLLLCLFSADEVILENEITKLEAEFGEGGICLLHILPAQSNAFQKEHFGFKDGIGQPVIPGLKKKGPAENTVPAGEFIMGHENAYAQLPDTPLVPKSLDPDNLLSEHPQRLDQKDLGKNGSYMVMRQLIQDVPGFWKQVKEAVEQEDPHAEAPACIHLAAKMVGRWPNGTPITLSPKGEKPDLDNANEFLYASDDKDAFKCPLGSHIRRANPRDAMPDNKPKKSVQISNRHRILRRGRNFGSPLVPDFQPEEMLTASDDGKERGLYFICFNTNISRQFEFIQHTWSNNTKFSGLYNDPDPILGIKDSRNKANTHDFTIEANPIRRKIRGLTRHVHVVGGGYFFMPGISALHFISQFNSTEA